MSGFTKCDCCQVTSDARPFQTSYIVHQVMTGLFGASKEGELNMDFCADCWQAITLAVEKCLSQLKEKCKPS